MVLASQMARPGTTRSNMYARGGARRNRLIAILAGGGVLLLAGWWFWPNSSSGADGRQAGNEATPTRSAALGSPNRDDSSSSVGAPANSFPENRQQTRPEPDKPELNPILPRGNEQAYEPIESPDADTSQSKPANNGTPPLTMGETPNSSKEPTPAESPKATDPPLENPASAPPKSIVPSGVHPEVAALVERAVREINAGRLVEGRATLNQALVHPRAGITAEEIRTRLAELNAMMVFGKTVVKGDPFATTHVIQSGDRLVFIAKQRAVDYRFLAHINGMSNPDQIRLGQSLKVINGPFHVEIDKSDYRLDVYLGEAGSSSRTYVRSFFIGLGELGSTPTGSFRVKSDSKLENPAWTNPRTGEHFKSGDPKNPIGKYWIGLEGTDAQTRLLDGYGIHGTIEPQSIGRQMSMGCVRLYDDDIKLLFGMLVPEKSTVIIRE